MPDANPKSLNRSAQKSTLQSGKSIQSAKSIASSSFNSSSSYYPKTTTTLDSTYDGESSESSSSSVSSSSSSSDSFDWSAEAALEALEEALGSNKLLLFHESRVKIAGNSKKTRRKLEIRDVSDKLVFELLFVDGFEILVLDAYKETLLTGTCLVNVCWSYWSLTVEAGKQVQLLGDIEETVGCFRTLFSAVNDSNQPVFYAERDRSGPCSSWRDATSYTFYAKDKTDILGTIQRHTDNLIATSSASGKEENGKKVKGQKNQSVSITIPTNVDSRTKGLFLFAAISVYLSYFQKTSCGYGARGICKRVTIAITIIGLLFTFTFIFLIAYFFDD